MLPFSSGGVIFLSVFGGLFFGLGISERQEAHFSANFQGLGSSFSQSPFPSSAFVWPSFVFLLLLLIIILLPFF